jgi:C-terminal processing protease CtpA/Prc
MNKLILILVMFPFVLFAQTEDYSALVQKALEQAKEHSLYTTEVNWDSLAKVVLEQAQEVKTKDDLKIPLTSIINGIRDHHARFFYNYQPIAYFTDRANTRSTDTRKRDQVIWKKVNYESKHEFQMIGKKTGYVKIIGINPQVDLQKESEYIRNNIIELARKGAKKWIIDLRSNGGGNMYPMLAGLAPIIGDGLVGSDVDYNGKTAYQWSIKHGDFYYGQYRAVSLPKTNTIQKNTKVVVLTSKYTVSSGEVVATIFKGRPNTYFIGEATGGYTTVVNQYAISDQLMLALSLSYYSDRNGTVYKQNIPVDQEIPFEIIDLKKDKAIKAAKKWLKKRR